MSEAAFQSDFPSVPPAARASDSPAEHSEAFIPVTSDGSPWGLKEEKPLKGFAMAWRRAVGYASIFLPNVAFAFAMRREWDAAGEPFQPHDVPANFFGVNVAPGPTPEHNAYVVERLKELRLRAVRLDYGYAEEHQREADDLIARLKAEGFEILLHLVQPPKDAGRMGDRKVDARWRDFLEATLDRHAANIAAVEPCSSINRFAWSGYAMKTYVRAAKIARDACRARGVRWFGPNATDFEPQTNVGLLSLLRRAKALPDVHSNNVFVDRVGQPESYDRRMGGFVNSRFPLDLVGKARVYAAIGRRFGVATTVSPYAYWTLNLGDNRKFRYAFPDEAARYLVRYMALAAAGGHLSQAYWGQLISYTKGIISDASGYKPRTPTVHRCWRLAGEVENYIVRPAFHAYAHLVRHLAGARFLRRVPTLPGTWLLEFVPAGVAESADPSRRLLVGWTFDGLVDDFARYAPPAERLVDARDVFGRELGAPPATLSCSPIFATYSGEPVAGVESTDDFGGLERLIFPPTNRRYRLVSRGGYRGLVREDLATESFLKLFDDPEALFASPEARKIKSGARGRLAEVSVTGEGAEPFRAIYKRFNPRALQKTAKRSRAARTWESTCDIMRREIPVPEPIALLERVDAPAASPSYLLTEKIDDAIQAREMLRAFRDGEPPPIPMTAKAFARQLGQFIKRMHVNGIFHRDLTGGNILINRAYREGDDGPLLDFTLIDVSRARFYRALGYRRRHLDLARVRVPKENRADFYLAYQDDRPGHFRKYFWRWQLATWLYRAKYNLAKPSRLWRAIAGKEE
jgi:tRNA A-37 threonylcarbamoyl transferase component Bud32